MKFTKPYLVPFFVLGLCINGKLHVGKATFSPSLSLSFLSFFVFSLSLSLSLGFTWAKSALKHYDKLQGVLRGKRRQTEQAPSVPDCSESLVDVTVPY